jgi:tetratricopeptide (TPR) repeat protein
MAYTLQGDCDRALADCNQLLALEPRNAQAYANRSIVYHFKGDVRQALLDYTRALQIDPQCLLTGMNQGLADNARLQTSQRIADYIDGLRQELPATDAPPPARFQIILQQPGTNGTAALAKPAPARRKPPPPGPAKENTAGPRPAAPLPKPVEAEATQAENTTTGPEAPAAEDPTAEETALEILSVEEDAPEDQAATAADTPTPVQSAPTSTEARPTLVPCPICRRETTPSETLSGGRVRCGVCKNVVLPAPASTPAAAPAPARAPVLPPRPPPRKPAKKKVVDEETSLWDRVRTPRGLAVTAASVLVLLGVGYFVFGTSDHVHVSRARGQAFFEGKPIPKALILFDPVWTQDPAFPKPRATVKEDGSFAVETYGKEDGAPPGEYRVLVQWLFKMDKNEVEGGGLPRNYLPARYGKFETSGLSVRIQEGDNDIPAFQLKR